MIYVHQDNILNKINENYNGKKHELEDFLANEYIPVKSKLESLKFNKRNKDVFKKASVIINNYREKLKKFALKYNIKSQSKFESSFLEELSVYLFKDLNEIKSDKYGFYNKGIFAGIKLKSDSKVGIITKDVDFCIGKKSRIKIDGQTQEQIIIPIIAVEVKTYLDATMFGEIKSSSKAIRSATPNSNTYVLMGYKEIKDEHIIASRQDSTLTEMFCLQKDKKDGIHYEVLYDYWKEVSERIKNINDDNAVNKLGRLLKTTT